jgi:hypothetical protein
VKRKSSGDEEGKRVVCKSVAGHVKELLEREKKKNKNWTDNIIRIVNDDP